MKPSIKTVIKVEMRGRWRKIEEKFKIWGSFYIVLGPRAGHWLWYHSGWGYPHHRDLYFASGPLNHDLHSTEQRFLHFPLNTQERQKEKKEQKTLSMSPDVLIRAHIFLPRSSHTSVWACHLATSVSATPRSPAPRTSFRTPKTRMRAGFCSLRREPEVLWNQNQIGSSICASEQPAVQVWQGGSGSGLRRGPCSKLNTRWVFSGGQGVCMCVLESRNQCGLFYGTF